MFMLWMNDFVGSSGESKLISTPSCLKTYKDTVGANLFILSILLFPKVWVSTVKAKAWKPFCATIFTNSSVYSVFFKRYN